MSAQTVINDALNQAALLSVGPVCMRPGMGTQASPRREATAGVSHFPGWDDGEECAWTPEACRRNYRGVCPQHHAAPVPASGVSLGKAGDPAPVASRPVPTPTTMVNIGSEGSWWGVPAHAVRQWITGYLAEGRYYRAAALSAELHTT